MPCRDFIADEAPAKLVTYHLRAPAHQFSRRNAAIRKYLIAKYPDHLRLASSSWIVKTRTRAAAVYADLKVPGPTPRLFDDADRLLIVDLRSDRWAPAGGDASLPHLAGWLKGKNNVWLVLRLARRSPVFNILRGAAHPTSSTWFLETIEPPDVVFKRLADAVDDRDVLAVVEHVPGEYRHFTPPDTPGVVVTYERFTPSPSLNERLTTKTDLSNLLTMKPHYWWHNMSQVWLVTAKARATAEKLRDELSPSIMGYDGLFVAALRGPRAKKGDVACLLPKPEPPDGDDED